MKKNRIIPTKGTVTTRGFIPHYNYKGIDLQVKQKYPAVWSEKLMRYRHRPPVTEDKYIVYALPGGGEFISNEKIS